MDEKQRKKISKFLSLILRHQPELVGLRLAENGWVNVAELLVACAKSGKILTIEELREVVETSDKKRFAFDESETNIRANQGHSVEVKIEFEERIPPKFLYHGTATRNIEIISAEGLKKMSRHHVHLSAEIETARNVGARYGKPVIFQVETEAMVAENCKFYISENGVWLVDEVAPKFLIIL